MDKDVVNIFNEKLEEVLSNFSLFHIDNAEFTVIMPVGVNDIPVLREESFIMYQPVTREKIHVDYIYQGPDTAPSRVKISFERPKEMTFLVSPATPNGICKLMMKVSPRLKLLAKQKYDGLVSID